MDRGDERKGLGEVIKSLRLMTPSRRENASGDESMSREELAEQAGVSAVMIAKIEQGVKSPSAATLKGIARAFGLDPMELSDRGALWAEVMGTASASQASLLRVATGTVAARAVLGLAGGATVAATGGAALTGMATGAALAAYYFNQRDRQGWEQALRQSLEERLAQADVKELRKIAVLLDLPVPPVDEE